MIHWAFLIPAVIVGFGVGYFMQELVVAFMRAKAAGNIKRW